MQTPWEYRYANRTQRMGSSVIRELLKLTEQPDIISFGGGLPAPEVFPIKQFQEAAIMSLSTMVRNRCNTAQRKVSSSAGNDRPSYRSLLGHDHTR